jgi:hypothetical protein
MTPFQRVAEMNEAFGNPKGVYEKFDWNDVRNQCKNIFDEYLELLAGLGFDPVSLAVLQDVHGKHHSGNCWTHPIHILAVRDSLCDIQVFAQGAQHKMGVNGDADMHDVIDGVMTRFIKDEADKQATIAKHAAKGVTQIYFEGEYPKMVMKSAVDQSDAPKGKFLKSASYKDTTFRHPDNV